MRYGKDNIKKLQKTSVSVATLPSGSVITIGGQRKVLSSSLTVDTAITGVGGFESGITVRNNYIVFAVLSGGAVSLIASQSAPSGYSQYAEVGRLRISDASEIYDVYTGSIISYQYSDINTNISGSFASPTLLFETTFTLLEETEVIFDGKISLGKSGTAYGYYVAKLNGATEFLSTRFHVGNPGSDGYVFTERRNFAIRKLLPAGTYNFQVGGINENGNPFFNPGSANAGAWQDTSSQLFIKKA
jgi:hypothetical protein